MRKLALLLIIFVTPVFGQYGTSFNIPQAPSNYGQDRVVVNGFECTSAVGNQKVFEAGALAMQNNVPTFNNTTTGSTSTLSPSPSGGVYGRIVIPLDGPKSRVDCSRLFELEMEKRTLELEFWKKNMTAPKDSEFKR